MAYINPAPGVANSQVVLKVELAGTSGWSTALTIPGLQDITINAANDVFTWTQLDKTAKLQVPTTSTNSLAMNIVLDDATFFGTTPGTVDPAAAVAVQGIQGLSRNKTKLKFQLKMEDGANDGSSTTTGDRYISGVAYVTGLAPKISADQPVWVSPITLTVSGEFTVGTATTDPS
jgi:hypothetical protein